MHMRQEFHCDVDQGTAGGGECCCRICSDLLLLLHRPSLTTTAPPQLSAVQSVRAMHTHTGLHGLALSRYQLQTVSADLQANRTIFQSASDQQYCIRYGKAVFTADELN